MVNARDVILETVCVCESELCVHICLAGMHLSDAHGWSWRSRLPGYEELTEEPQSRGQGPQDPRIALDPELEMEAFNSDARTWFLSTLQENLEANSVPVKLLDASTLPNTLSAGFWDHEWRTQPSCDQTPDSEKLWYNKCALVKATQFVLTYNTVREK